MQSQVFDNIKNLERERGITIKAQTVRIIYKAKDGEGMFLTSLILRDMWILIMRYPEVWLPVTGRGFSGGRRSGNRGADAGKCISGSGVMIWM